MEPETIIFMPNGDVTLSLTRHITKEVEKSRTSSVSSEILALEAELNEDGRLGGEREAVAETPQPDESYMFYAPDPPDEIEGAAYPPVPRAVRGSDASSRRDRSASPPASFWASLKRQAARMQETIEEEDEPVTNEPKKARRTKLEKVVVGSHEVHCIVSSRHMMLASQQFQDLLSGNTTEAAILRAKGHVTIPMSADLDLMIIILNIVHGASRKVPRQIALDELSKLAVLVCSMGMVETVQFFSDTWIDSLEKTVVPKTYNPNVVPLLFVFWAFDRAEEFKKMTRLAQRECDENLDGHLKDLPIPHKIIGI